jgi:predicted Zn-dependent peptidase
MIINLKSDIGLSGFYVVYDGSTNLEKSGWHGISHLMEHLIAKNIDHLQEKLDIDGINWNAYTTNNEIVFYLTGTEEKVNYWKGEFLELIGGFKATKEDFEKERKIVLEEYTDSFNEQTDSHQMNLDRKLFNNYNPIGSREDLEKMTFMDCLNFFELQYAKPSKIINVSKKEYKNNLIDFSDRYIHRDLVYGNHQTKLELNNNFSDKSSLIILSPVIEDNFAVVSFINSMLSSGLNSPLYKEVREKRGLVYYIHCYQRRLNNNGIVNISTKTSNNNINKVIDAVRGVIKNPNKFMTKDRFNIIKESFKIKAQKEDILRYQNVQKYINPDGWSIYDILDSVKYSQVMDIYSEYFDFDKFYISNDKTEFRS